MLFVPSEPLAAGAGLPTVLTAKFDALAKVGWGLPGHNLLREEMSVKIPLPKPGRSIIQAVAPFADPDGRPRTNNAISYGGYINLETAIYLARAKHYGEHADSRKPNTPEMRRHNYWSERAIAASTNLDVQFYREGLAHNYQEAGEFSKARRLLQDMLHEDRFLKLKVLLPDRSSAAMKKAQAELRKQNEFYFKQAREMLSALDKASSIQNIK
jgi:hypothetical protein